LFYVGVLSVVVGIARGLVPEDNFVFQPQMYLDQVKRRERDREERGREKERETEKGGEREREEGKKRKKERIPKERKQLGQAKRERESLRHHSSSHSPFQVALQTHFHPKVWKNARSTKAQKLFDELYEFNIIAFLKEL
jgi:hypothetical protein